MTTIANIKGTIIDRAATFYEQEIVMALESNELTQSKEAVQACLQKCYDEGKSFSQEFRKLDLDDSWRADLMAIADKATTRLHAWMAEVNLHNNISPLVQYNHVDEKGRAYKPIPLAALEANGHYFQVEHKPSIANSTREAPLLVPVFGWVHDKESMEKLIAEDRIAYGLRPWDTAYQKNFLN